MKTLQLSLQLPNRKTWTNILDIAARKLGVQILPVNQVRINVLKSRPLVC